MQLYQPTITGSLLVSGSITATGGITVSGSITSASYAASASNALAAQSASYVLNGVSASYAASASNALAAATASYVLNGVSASYAASASNTLSASNAVTAQTASYANTFTVGSTLTAQTLVVQTITSSIVYSSGSNIFGNSSSNTQTFTGSIYQTGSIVSFTGNIGVGTPNPTNAFHASSSLPRVIVDTTSRYAAFNTYVNGVEKGAFYWDNTDNVLRVQGANVGLNYGGSAGNIGLYVSASGNVGIGTTTPTSISTYRTLEIYGSTGAGIRLWNGSNALNIQTNGTDAYINNTANGNLYLYTNDTPRLIISSSGNVIVGPDGASSTSKITSYLGSSVISGTNDGIRLQVQSYNTLARNTIVWGQNGSNLNLGRFGLEWDSSTSLMNFVWRDIYSGSAAGSTELMRLRGDGNVGIGTSSPIDKLEVAGSVVTSGTAAASKGSSAYFDWYSTGARIGVLGPNTTTLGTFRIDQYSSNAATSSAPFYINALGATIMYNNMANVDGLEIYDTQTYATNTGGTINFGGKYNAAGTYSVHGRVSGRKENSTDGNNAGYLLFATRPNGGGATERMRVTSDGYLRLLSTSPGIQFNGNSSSANALNAYEEGTWTPVVKVGTTTNTASSTKGLYTKIGRVVYIQATITGITKSGTGGLSVEGLPFTVGTSSTFGDVQATLRWDDITSDGVIYPYFVSSGTKMIMQNYSNTGYTGEIQDTALSATYQLYGISGFYMV